MKHDETPYLIKSGYVIKGKYKNTWANPTNHPRCVLNDCLEIRKCRNEMLLARKMLPLAVNTFYLLLQEKSHCLKKEIEHNGVNKATDDWSN